MELLAWELRRRPNAVAWGLLVIGPPNYSFDDIKTMSFTTLLSAPQMDLRLTAQEQPAHRGWRAELASRRMPPEAAVRAARERRRIALPRRPAAIAQPRSSTAPV